MHSKMLYATISLWHQCVTFYWMAVAEKCACFIKPWLAFHWMITSNSSRWSLVLYKNMVHGVINERRSYEFRLHDDDITWNRFTLMALCEVILITKYRRWGCALFVFFMLALTIWLTIDFIYFLSRSFLGKEKQNKEKFIVKDWILNTSRKITQNIQILLQTVAGVILIHQRIWRSWIYYSAVIMSAMASQITSLAIVYSTVYSGAYQRKHQSSASLAFVRGIHRWPVNSPHKGPVTQKMFLFEDVIMMK